MAKIRHIQARSNANRAKQVAMCLTVFLLLSGCADFPGLAKQPALAATEADASAENDPVETMELLAPTQTNLTPGSRLYKLAAELDQVAIEQSSAVHDVRAAEAALKARGFDRYPKATPTASASIIGDDSASIGVNLEQVIWDGGRISARLSDAELSVADAGVRAWKDRNETVFRGLEAYIQAARYEARLRSFAKLKTDLQAIAALLKSRLKGGVADRGELLRMSTALQEVERRSLTDAAALRQQKAEFARWLPDYEAGSSVSDLGSASSQCRRDWPQTEAPDDALSRVDLARAAVSESFVKAQRLPSILLTAGTSLVGGALSVPGLGIRIDASDMLGFGRRGNLDAAAAETQAAAATYDLQQDDTKADLSRLEADYEGMRADAVALRGLVNQGEDTLDLYKEQLDAGSIPLTEGIVLHRERTDTVIALIDVQADILLNCLRSSRQRGLLAPFGALENED